MAKISKNLMDKDINRKIWHTLVQVFREVKTDEEVEILLNDLLTPGEKIMFSKRLAIAFLLSEGKTYAEVSKKLKVSFATINSVKNSKLRGGSGYRHLLEMLRKKLLN